MALLLVLITQGIKTNHTYAQTFTTSSNLVAQPVSDRTVIFNVEDEGESKPITWGLDLAWLDEINVIRGIRFMGEKNVDVIRSSFMPTDTLVGDTALQGDALTNTNERISIITDNLGTAPGIVLNSDHPTVDSYFYGHPEKWAKLIDITRKMHEDAGLTVITVSPFNEPDYTATGQGDIDDFYDICGVLRDNSDFDDIRISGGNTLNNDNALSWYNTLKDRLDEGNTHQLAGTFDNYATFYETVRDNGDHASNDELHNVMEAMVGVEYGLQTGIWWGAAENARGKFCKASDGERLAYSEHRDNWTSAAVYRNTSGDILAFGGTSERQGVATSYRFLSKDRPVFYDGYGPQYEYIMDLPGGETGSYQNGQTNAETVVNITWGDDVQPVIDGKYILVNRNSGKVMEPANGNKSNGTNVRQGAYSGATYQQWNVTPIDPENGGDFSYFNIVGVPSEKHLDIENYSLDNGGNALLYAEGTYWDERQALNQVWYLEYASDGWFYIRNQYSSYCLEVASASTDDGANIQQYEYRGGKSQQWRFIPAGVAEVEFDAPGAPANLVATASSESIQLEWTANTESDVAGYTIYRSETSGGDYNIIARNVTATTFIDNSATGTETHYYVISAVDSCLNTSEYSNQVAAAATNQKCLLAKYSFEYNLLDSSINLNSGASQGDTSFTEGVRDSKSLLFYGSDAFVQLPPKLVSQDSITIAVWVYWRGGGILQRIFDFGCSETERMYLTTSTGLVGGNLQFGIINGDNEEVLSTDLLTIKTWTHVAVTLKDNEARMYVNGELVDESDDFTLSPTDINPILNYIGRSQDDDNPYFYGRLDDLIIYNFALSKEEVEEVMTTGSVEIDTANLSNVTNNLADKVNSLDESLSIWPVPARDELNINFSGASNIKTNLAVYSINGTMVINKEVSGPYVVLNTSGLATGVYSLRLTNKEATATRKFIVE